MYEKLCTNQVFAYYLHLIFIYLAILVLAKVLFTIFKNVFLRLAAS